ncbi:hypothetical protein [Demequina sp. NBRC 110054]|uniref:hypothetical protein n=1 Tax=Demequina sp. NBRC 110054 TaxID=1570343 RepID=UPI000A07A6D4|nr:hypothetical protein [Demequina sp. NBRC 110054]
MRRALVALATAAAVLAVAGCTPEVPEPVAAPSVEAAAALQEEQAQAVIDDTFKELKKADKKLDASVLGNRVDGQAKRARKAQYKLKKDNKKYELTDIPSEMQAVYLPAAGEWPRVMAAVTEQPDDDLTPLVLVWVQESIEDDYTLVGWAHMVPGATLPSMPGATSGTTVLDMDTDTIDPTPQQAYEDYLKLLRSGAKSDLNDSFADDTYRQRLFAARKELTKTAKESDGEFVDTINPDMDGTFAISTADGGAIVFAPLTVRSSISVKDATIIIADDDQPLVDGKIKRKVTYTYADFIVMYVPGAGADTLPGVVAADHTLIKLSAG